MSVPKKNAAPWSPADVKKMRSLAKKGLSSRLAAVQLQRSRGAVAFKAMVEGVRFHAIRQPTGVQKRIARRNRRGR